MATKKRRNCYLSHLIQNELINSLGNKVKNKIIELIKHCKYYSILLDCTLDISHQEQLSVVLRCVYIKERDVKIVEYLIAFVVVDDTTGKGLYETIKDVLNTTGLKLSDCRGQGYENGANMKGLYKGMQAYISRENPKAFYIPCGCHNLNLLLGDIAKCSVIAVNFFSTLQKIYNIFAASTSRWNILKKHVKRFSPHSLSETRWECRVESVKAVLHQISYFQTALVEISNAATDNTIKSEIISIEQKLTKFEFILSLTIWYDLLSKVNFVSKILQNPTMQIAVSHLRELLVYFEEF